MTNRTERDVGRPGRPEAPAMPRQAPPVDRTRTTTAGVRDDASGVEADGILTDVLAKFLPF